MRKTRFIIPIIGLTLLSGCSSETKSESKDINSANITEIVVSEATNSGYIQITQEEAHNIIVSQNGYILLDVRTDEEFSEGHIPGAMLIPDYEIEERAEKELPDKAKTILVYCRSGRRSKVASEALVKMGYSDVREFGGIIDWQYGIE